MQYLPILSALDFCDIFGDSVFASSSNNSIDFVLVSALSRKPFDFFSEFESSSPVKN